ncbi:MAG: hypothetical protein QOK31_1, partial [Solirubrobacteraceae bacterium]|nr:hypothetical protein [Solirubrobacteraceae bacterium]
MAVLQEVPPWWPATLASACGAQHRAALTSRNAVAGARRAIAARRPDLLGANGGGANVILVRGAIVAHARLRLRTWPERRVVHAIALPDGTWVANVHASTRPAARIRADVARAGSALMGWARGAPAVLAGDFNLRDPQVPGFTAAAGHEVDHVLARGLERDGPAQTLVGGALSDHA